MSGIILKAEGLTVGYKSKTVLRDIFLSVETGKMICLLGPNGAGKSTVLHTFAGILEPVGGKVLLDGREIGTIRAGDLAKKISVVLTGSDLPGLTTVRELAAMGRSPYTGFFGRISENDEKIIDDSLRSVGAYELRDRYCSELSDGEKQKVLIARALVQEPQLILLDEPTSHLDISRKVEVMRILNRLAAERGISVVMSMHDIDLAVKCSDYIVLVKDGEVQSAGAPEDVIVPGMIDRLYDLSGAGYDELIGGVELSGGTGRDVFVAGRAGSAAPVMRKIAKNGYGVGFGASVSYDIDAHAAKKICVDSVITESVDSPEVIRAKILKTARMYSIAVESAFENDKEGRVLSGALDELEENGVPVIRRDQYDSLGDLVNLIRNKIALNNKEAIIS